MLLVWFTGVKGTKDSQLTLSFFFMRHNHVLDKSKIDDMCRSRTCRRCLAVQAYAMKLPAQSLHADDDARGHLDVCSFSDRRTLAAFYPL